ncbi:hypothetical protein [Paenibacillus mucilaginosus]|uniref:Uncharacterized protein n=1 Tax=Paenibacillus mucilaginosus (strain KNP414) TaxID=1036673 RepID=F8FDJ8_PAEMK|nr:hypothetical protein [Paenibacillus mucilaginosus]AEI42168.1 hypothetical protein KNP414_03624 [Paenibacillus mucilaginosus KNP414]MCG7214140.1 hypothetical protein [Paenibacillus mucilaginosus]WDM28660.1 hypothetical protein KCX80_05410 [Paenibacillus mucilaginosus]
MELWMDMPLTYVLYASAGQPAGVGLVAGIVAVIMVGGISAGMVMGRREIDSGTEEESAFIESEQRPGVPPRRKDD